MADFAIMGGPFVLLLLLTFGVLLAALGAFMLIWSRGKPRVYGTGFLVIGLTVLGAAMVSILNGNIISGMSIIMDVLLPTIIYLLAIGIGAVLAIVPFLVAAIRT